MATGRMIIICGRECSEGEDFQELWVNYKDDSECTAQKDAHAHRFSNNPDTRMNFREAAIEMEYIGRKRSQRKSASSSYAVKSVSTVRASSRLDNVRGSTGFGGCARRR